MTEEDRTNLREVVDSQVALGHKMTLVPTDVLVRLLATPAPLACNHDWQPWLANTSQCSCCGARRDDLAATPAPLDVERLARAIEASGPDWPSCAGCGAEITYHAECDEGDSTLVWEPDAAAIAAAYAEETP